VQRSVLGTVCDFVYEISRGTAEEICCKFVAKTCLAPRWDKFECQGQMSRSPGTKRHFFGPSAACMQFVKTSLALVFGLM